MAAQQTLSAEKETEAKELVGRLREVADEELLLVARLLVSKPESEVFGETEVQIRDLLLRLGGKVVEKHLSEKKTATSATASRVEAVGKLRNSMGIDRKRS